MPNSGSPGRSGNRILSRALRFADF